MRRRQRGQVLPIAAVLIIVMIGIAGLTIDGGRDYLIHRQAQNATDLAALAAGKQLAASGSILGGPPRSGDLSVIAAHDFAGNNGFNTIYGNGCDSRTATAFSATWFDVTGLACSASGGYSTRIQVNSPPVALPGVSIPGQCSGATQYNCFQVTITSRIQHFFTGVLGIPIGFSTTSAVVFAQPPVSAFPTPPPHAVYLYQPQAGCEASSQQCFDESKAPSRQGLACDGSNNCPTLWVRPGTHPTLNGIDGTIVSPQADFTAVQSNGDAIFQDRTTICDPYNRAACANNTAVGLKGFALSGGSKAYCSQFGGGGSGSAPPCTTGGPGGAPLSEVDTNETGFAPATWSPTVSTAGLKNCGSLVLNGFSVQSSNGSCFNTAEPYTIQPGIYQSIAINHGTYSFEGGLYDITGTAPVNTLTAAGYTANGIDHSRESGSDFDLCTGGQPASCPTLTAGVWIGHGGGSYGALVGGGGTCLGGGGTAGGGGDPTIISGSGVTFRFESGSAGFVATHEVSSIGLSSPGLGEAPYLSGVPLLFDLENNSWVHLDGNTAKGAPASGYIGIVYQTQNATAGGVDLNPGLGGNNRAALSGQVFANSLTTFGTQGIGVDFSSGFGTAGNPPIATSGKNETSIISTTQLVAGPTPGTETFVLNYTDEWALDAYDVYVKVNSGSAVFFSQGIWNPAPLPNQPQPPSANTPGDNFPAVPDPSNPGVYTTAPDPVTGLNTDWTLALPNGAGKPASAFEVSGNWTWGHEADLAGSTSASDTAQVRYSFPTPAGSVVTVTVFLTDGDHCGDYALASATFNNVGQPLGGLTTGGSVRLIQ